MKNIFFNNRYAAPSLAALAVVVVTAITVFASGPTGTPTNGNVDANFNSVTAGSPPTASPTAGTVYATNVNATGVNATNVSFGPNGTNGTLTGAYGRYVGSVGSDIGFTTKGLITSGSLKGYAAAAALCGAQYPKSHVCSAKEIINTYEYNTSLLPATGQFWINNGPPSYIADLTNDCQGWTTNNNKVFGTFWDFTKGGGWASPCSQAKDVSCCSN